MIPGEICPKCGLNNNIYTDSRVRDTGFRKRRKQCLSCGNRWSTVEILDEVTEPMNRTYEIKTDGKHLYLRCIETAEVIKLKGL